MAVPDSDYILLRRRFDDFDRFATEIRAWDLDFRQLDRGQSTAAVSQLIGPGVLFTHARFNRHYHQQGSTPPGMRTFALLEDHVSGIHWFGREVTTTSLMCFPASKVLEAVSRPDFEVYTISFSEELLRNTACMLGLPELENILCNEDRLANCSPDSIQLIRNRLRRIRNYTQQDSATVDNPEIRHILENELPALLLTALTNSRDIPREKQAQWKKQQALKKSGEYIREFPHEPISVRALSQHAEVSVRTLEEAFKEYYGVTPKNYLKATRLNGAYRQLLDRNAPVLSIADVANQWGFWHMGQFAADYKRLFDELPSSTRRRKP